MCSVAANLWEVTAAEGLAEAELREIRKQALLIANLRIKQWRALEEQEEQRQLMQTAFDALINHSIRERFFARGYREVLFSRQDLQAAGYREVHLQSRVVQQGMRAEYRQSLQQVHAVQLRGRERRLMQHVLAQQQLYRVRDDERLRFIRELREERRRFR